MNDKAISLADFRRMRDTEERTVAAAHRDLQSQSGEMRISRLADELRDRTGMAVEREYHFASIGPLANRAGRRRKWRFDIAFPEIRLAIEIDGGNWIRGGHNTGGGRNKNNEKYRQAIRLGWRVLTYTTDELDEKWPLILDEIEAESTRQSWCPGPELCTRSHNQWLAGLAQPQTQEYNMGKFVGKWPGDETEEDLLDALKKES